ncbi:MAG: tetratricopeptide repeat protein [Akkermansiaceae bacterium]|nr:tetratricopeptide repeat protein [Akkermansiaceae bacterium]
MPALAVLAVSCSRKSGPTTATGPAPEPVFALSTECVACHRDFHESWRNSHHALAHRDLGKVEDTWAFVTQTLKAGTAEWKFSGGVASPLIEWTDPASDAEAISLKPDMAIGHRPLIQYLLDFGDGRYQTPDASWDPVKKEWFSMFGKDQRRPHEWGHWSQRGMNWNSNCAYCHLTNYRKNYQPDTDGYRSTWVEQGVGCAQCHGPVKPGRATHECMIDIRKQFTNKQWMHSCATCHARREEFDEKFVIGDEFFDHYDLALPGQPGLYHADGQQIDENYNTTSLLLSRMGHKGISCVDCHDSHAATPRGGKAAVADNSLCMKCHASGQQGAVVIDPATHTFHKPGTEGSRCVDCHMPKDPYMARDPRSDHRFPSPDPLLTKELGIPNSCNDCHAKEGLDWQIKYAEQWYGQRYRRHDRDRTRAIAAAITAPATALPGLLAAYDREEIAAWQATMLRLMASHPADERVRDRANRAATHPEPVVRGAAAFLLGQQPSGGEVWRRLTRDPVRAVRLNAGWAGLNHLTPADPLIAELDAVARHQSDQPGGRMRLALLANHRGDHDTAAANMRKAADWDGSSAAPLRDLAVHYSQRQRPRDAVEALREAVKREPNNADLPYLLSLAQAEAGDTKGTEESLLAAIRLAPGHARAHYNLGLLYNSQGKRADAIVALRKATELDPQDPAPPYALATIHLQLGQREAAAEAAREALRRNPGSAEAAAVLQAAEAPPGQ